MNRRSASTRPTLSRRPVMLRRAAPSSGLALRAGVSPVALPEASPAPSNPPDAFVGYSRTLTAEGGILIQYTEADLSSLWPIIAWTCATGFELWFVLYHSPAAGFFANLFGIILVAALNWWIVGPPEAVRSIEVRSDCMIIDGQDVFWQRMIGDNWPAFKADEKHPDRKILCGIYGTRYVEYATAAPVDENDRTPDVLAGHLHDAMMKLWGGDTEEEGAGPWSAARRR